MLATRAGYACCARAGRRHTFACTADPRRLATRTPPPRPSPGRPARQGDLTEAEWESVKSLGLLSAKPVIYAANVEDSDLADGNDMVRAVEKHAASEGASVVVVSAQVV